MAVQYFYIGAAPTLAAGVGSAIQRPTATTSGVVGSVNPVFNFDPNYFSQLQSVSQTDLAQSVPYISLNQVGLDGAIVQNFNLNYFHKPADFAQIGAQRYAERAPMSLKNVEIRADLATGYIYFLDVKISIKIHRPDILHGSGLMSLLYPGAPLELTYGWKSSSAILNIQETIVVAVRDYTITLDALGQADLTISATAFNDRFKNTLVGDEAQDLTTAKTGNKQTDGLLAAKLALDDLRRAQQNPNAAERKLVKNLATKLSSAETRARGLISNIFKTRLNSITPVVEQGKKVVYFHNLISALAGPTLNAMEGAIFPSGGQYRLIYGTFNDKFGTRFANKSIADFPINWAQFEAKLGQEGGGGQRVVTVEGLLNILIREFIQDDKYWSGLQSHQGEINEPDVVLNFSSRVVNGVRYNDIYIVDVNAGIPVTTSLLPNGPASQEQVEAQFRPLVPILALGHANSFIKTVSLSHIVDQNMKSVFIKRQFDSRSNSLREPVTADKAHNTSPQTPLTLPLKGEASVIGHVEWKPFRAFYLSSGIYLVDGVYKITDVTHTLSHEGFSTKIGFMYH